MKITERREKLITMFTKMFEAANEFQLMCDKLRGKNNGK